MMKALRLAAVAASLLAFGSVAMAATGGTPQTHHCKLPDGTTDATKTKAQCKTAKGTWALYAAAPASAPASKAPASQPAAKQAPASQPAN